MSAGGFKGLDWGGGEECANPNFIYVLEMYPQWLFQYILSFGEHRWWLVPGFIQPPHIIYLSIPLSLCLLIWLPSPTVSVLIWYQSSVQHTPLTILAIANNGASRGKETYHWIFYKWVWYGMNWKTYFILRLTFFLREINRNFYIGK